MSSKRVFVSYSRRDTRLVRHLVDNLDRTGHDVWIDVEGIPAGAWAGHIVEAIRRADVFLLVLTRASAASREVAKEVSLAASRHVPIIPVVVAPAPPIPDEIAYHIAGQQRIMLDPEDLAIGVRQVIRAVEGSVTQGQVRTGRALIGGAVGILVVAALGSVVVTAVTGRLPPWTSTPTCSTLRADVVSARPATFVSLAGAALDISFINTSDREAGLPMSQDVTVTGATGTHYAREPGLVSGGWFLSETVAPGSTRTLALGITGRPPPGGRDTITVHVAGASEGPIPFLRCNLVAGPVQVEFAQ